MQDRLMVVARQIELIVKKKKMLSGTRADILIELRDEGALGSFDRGTGSDRRDTEATNLKKFTILNHGLTRAVDEGMVLLNEEEYGEITLGAPHHKPPQVQRIWPDQPWSLTLDEPDFDKLPPMNGALAARLREWGWGQIEELVS